MAESQELAKLYQKKTDKQHVLDNPDTYTGSMEKTDAQVYLFEEDRITSKQIELVPGAVQAVR